MIYAINKLMNKCWIFVSSHLFFGYRKIRDLCKNVCNPFRRLYFQRVVLYLKHAVDVRSHTVKMRLADSEYANLLCRIFLAFQIKLCNTWPSNKTSSSVTFCFHARLNTHGSLGIVFVYFSAAAHACCDARQRRVQVAP